MPIDTESLTQVFHEHGINMRYLSHVAVSSQVPHVKELCLTEMLARTCKNILNYQLSQLILENKEDYDRFGVAKKQKKIEQGRLEREKRLREQEKQQQQAYKLNKGQ